MGRTANHAMVNRNATWHSVHDSAMYGSANDVGRATVVYLSLNSCQRFAHVLVKAWETSWCSIFCCV